MIASRLQTIKLNGELLLGAVAWSDAASAKCWLAVIKADHKQPGGLGRTFLRKAGSTLRSSIGARYIDDAKKLVVGCVTEWGADVYRDVEAMQEDYRDRRRDSSRVTDRAYAVLVGRSEDALEFRVTETWADAFKLAKQWRDEEPDAGAVLVGADALIGLGLTSERALAEICETIRARRDDRKRLSAEDMIRAMGGTIGAPSQDEVDPEMDELAAAWELTTEELVELRRQVLLVPIEEVHAIAIDELNIRHRPGESVRVFRSRVVAEIDARIAASRETTPMGDAVINVDGPVGVEPNATYRITVGGREVTYHSDSSATLQETIDGLQNAVDVVLPPDAEAIVDSTPEGFTIRIRQRNTLDVAGDAIEEGFDVTPEIADGTSVHDAMANLFRNAREDRDRGNE